MWTAALITLTSVNAVERVMSDATPHPMATLREKIRPYVWGEGGVADTNVERIMAAVEAACTERERLAVMRAFQKHHEQYPDCPPRLLAQPPQEQLKRRSNV